MCLASGRGTARAAAINSRSRHDAGWWLVLNWELRIAVRT